MTGNHAVRVALGQFRENELILAGKLYLELFTEQVSEAAYYKTLERMCTAGELLKIAKGTYCIPKESKYGIVPPSETEIISAFTKNETGMVIGYGLYNSLGLTTQVSKQIEVISSMLESGSKTIRNITVYRVPLRYSPEVQNIISGFEVLQNFRQIQNLNYPVFFKFAEAFSRNYNNVAFETVIVAKKYRKSTISFMRELLNYYSIENDLSKYLSSLSSYKHPKIEELIAATISCADIQYLQ